MIDKREELDHFSFFITIWL